MRLIDFPKVKKLFNEEYLRKMQLVRDGETYLDNMAEGFMGADKVIFMLPDIDAVEVVRCEKCKHYEDHKREIYENCVRGGILIPMKPTDFCSYGERKEGAE